MSDPDWAGEVDAHLERLKARPRKPVPRLSFRGWVWLGIIVATWLFWMAVFS